MAESGAGDGARSTATDPQTKKGALATGIGKGASAKSDAPATAGSQAKAKAGAGAGAGSQLRPVSAIASSDEVAWKPGPVHAMNDVSGSVGADTDAAGVGKALCLHPGLPMAVVAPAAHAPVQASPRASASSASPAPASAASVLTLRRFSRSVLLSTGSGAPSPSSDARAAQVDLGLGLPQDEATPRSMAAVGSSSVGTGVPSYTATAAVIDASTAAARVSMEQLGESVGRGGIAVWALLRPSEHTGTDGATPSVQLAMWLAAPTKPQPTESKAPNAAASDETGAQEWRATTGITVSIPVEDGDEP